MENELTVLDMHNSYLSYIIHILPVVMPNHLIQETGKFRCCPVLSKIWNSEIFDPSDLKQKWKLILSSLTSINGTPTRLPRQRIRPANQLPPTGATSVPPTERVIVREYEPAPINRLREEKRESIIRSNLHAFFTSMDSQLKALYPPNKFTWPDQKPTGLANRWKFHDSASEEPPAKKQKSDRDESSSSVLPPPPSPELAEGDLCVICMEKARTHAFLHYGLADQDVTSHFVACQDCANSCRWADQGCPCCRKPCINVIRVLK